MEGYDLGLLRVAAQRLMLETTSKYKSLYTPIFSSKTTKPQGVTDFQRPSTDEENPKTKHTLGRLDPDVDGIANVRRVKRSASSLPIRTTPC